MPQREGERGMLLPKGWTTQHSQVLLLPTRVRSSPLLSCIQELFPTPGSWKQASRNGGTYGAPLAAGLD